MSKQVIRDEGWLTYFMRNNVLDPVTSIIAELKEVEEARMAFDLGNGILFCHKCVYRSDNAGSSRPALIYVYEYKSPHELTAPHLRVGLCPMNIYKDVVNRKTIPTSVDPDGCFQYHAKRLTALAITEIYQYMIEGGLEYGLLTTGEAIVFLKVDWREPETLFYHLAEPEAETAAHPNHFRLCTAVGQYLAFDLMALGPAGERRLHGQEERRQATENLKTWNEDFETTLRSIPEDERNAPKSSPGYIPEAYEGVDRSPYHKRRSQRILAQQAREQGGERGASNDKEQGRPYCKQKCLAGLVNGDVLDPRCPNMSLHSRQPSNHHGHDTGPGRAHARHPIDHAEFLELLRQQLERILDDGITPLGLSGACGVLFRVTLLAYCYTFVSKGTFREFVKDLEHEAAVYRRLQPIQGRHVPVFLGAIDLLSMNQIYYYDYRAYVIHMTFLSWGGNEIDLAIADGAEGELEGGAVRSLRAIHQLGVLHKDIRRPNMLFNAEINGVLIIDFERALLLEPPRHALAQVVPNKRKREAEKPDDRGREIFSEEIWMLRVLFRNMALLWRAKRA